MNKCLSILLASGVFLSSVCLAQSSGMLINAAELKSQPFIDAAAVAKLAGETPLSILKNQGAWSMVKTNDGKEGWVRLLNVRPGKLQEKPAGVGQTVSQIGGVFRTGTKANVATTGVKGLSKEDIKNSKPNPGEVKRLDSLKAKPGEAEQFASNARLVAKDVPELKP